MQESPEPTCHKPDGSVIEHSQASRQISHMHIAMGHLVSGKLI